MEVLGEDDVFLYVLTQAKNFGYVFLKADLRAIEANERGYGHAKPVLSLAIRDGEICSVITRNSCSKDTARLAQKFLDSFSELVFGGPALDKN